MAENRLLLDNHLLVCIDVFVDKEDLHEYAYLRSNFCGRVVYASAKDLGTLDFSTTTTNVVVYVCGNIGLLRAKRKNVLGKVNVVKEFSHSIERDDAWELVTLGQVSCFLRFHDSVELMRLPGTNQHT